MTTTPTLPAGQVGPYLERIGIDRQPEASRAWLERLHLAHLLRVPFENIDLHANEPIRLDVAALFDKLVGDRRGGYCYELNGLFAALLATVGFDVTLVAARVWMPDGELSPPFDHLALMVDLHATRWLVDVGYGDAFTTPRPLGSRWTEADRRLRTVETGNGWQLEKDPGDGWVPMYLLDLTPRDLPEFLPRCRWHEASPDSPFRRGVFASRATPTGRVTVTHDRLVITRDGQRTERGLPEARARRRALDEHFSPSVASAFQAAARSPVTPPSHAPGRSSPPAPVSPR